MPSTNKHTMPAELRKPFQRGMCMGVQETVVKEYRHSGGGVLQKDVLNINIIFIVNHDTSINFFD